MTPAAAAARAGGTAANSTFFCEYSGVKCYSHSFLTRGFNDAAADCIMRRGELVEFVSAEEQRLVETYFGSYTTLSKNYWHGVRRANSSGAFARLKGGALAQVPSDSPYSHWSYNQPLFTGKAGYDCGAAFADTRYSIFQGGGMSAAQLVQPANYLASATHTVPSTYGWAGYDCNTTMRFVCMILAANFPMAPPPSPPADPPYPPSPPAPPLPPSCAPPGNATFFCAAHDNGLCYLYNRAFVTQPAARRYCLDLGGDLAMPEFPDDQLAAERYFARTGVLSSYYYWTGVSRANASAPYQLSNGGVISQRYSDDLYAHWALGHYAAARNKDYNCVLAAASLAYDLFTGDAGDDNALLDPSLYTSTPTNKYAWAAAVCTGTYNFMCQVHADVFACNPPPSPSPAPPSPPSPPSPPLEPNCAPAANTTFFCQLGGCYSYSARPATFAAAQQACAAMVQAPGAQLVLYGLHTEQQAVEQYFATKGPLPAYWQGISRAGAGQPYMQADGAPLPQEPSPLLDVPYAHWAWPSARLAANATANLSCVVADPAFAYDRYLGGAGATEAANASLYEARASAYSDRKYGWMPVNCSARTLMPYICEAPPEAFPCFDPPSPPPPPPYPPPPPSPPAPPTCRRRLAAAASLLRPRAARGSPGFTLPLPAFAHRPPSPLPLQARRGPAAPSSATPMAPPASTTPARCAWGTRRRAAPAQRRAATWCGTPPVPSSATWRATSGPGARWRPTCTGTTSARSRLRRRCSSLTARPSPRTSATRTPTRTGTSCSCAPPPSPPTCAASQRQTPATTSSSAACSRPTTAGSTRGRRATWTGATAGG
jgi:hypothetical protein